jgi:hypothetical protein
MGERYANYLTSSIYQHFGSCRLNGNSILRSKNAHVMQQRTRGNWSQETLCCDHSVQGEV